MIRPVTIAAILGMSGAVPGVDKPVAPSSMRAGASRQETGLMLVRAAAFAAIAVAGSGFGVCLAAEPSGEAVAVIQSAAVEGASGNRPLKVKGTVFTGDVVKTNRAGQAQLLFKDDTKLVVGPNSELTIDRFVFANQSTAREFTINAVRGAFRFITGSSQKQAYTIKTPSATIGVRGTRFDVTVRGQITNLAVYEGGVRLCDITKPTPRCVDISERCDVVIVGPEEDLRRVRNVYERTELMDTVFPYAFRQQALRADFRVRSRACEIRDLFKPGKGSDGKKPKKEPETRGGQDGID
jgi:hypothetical protein